MRGFVGIDLGREPAPDETTVCRFRHLFEQHDLGQRLFDEMQRHLAAKGLKVATGTIVDATIINVPSSTKNVNKARDPEMHRTLAGPHLVTIRLDYAVIRNHRPRWRSRSAAPAFVWRSSASGW